MTSGVDHCGDTVDESSHTPIGVMSRRLRNSCALEPVMARGCNDVGSATILCEDRLFHNLFATGNGTWTRECGDLALNRKVLPKARAIKPRAGWISFSILHDVLASGCMSAIRSSPRSPLLPRNVRWGDRHHIAMQSGV